MDDFKQRVEEIKAAIRIEEIINEDEPLKDSEHGLYRQGKVHDSLKVSIKKQYYKWNSKNETGDVFDWLRLHRGLEFKESIVYLAKRAGLEPPKWSPQQEQASKMRRDREAVFAAAAKFYHEALCQESTAIDYCQSRGWSGETVAAAGLGYWSGNIAALKRALEEAQIDVTSPAAVALLGDGGRGTEDGKHKPMPGHVLVYPHVRGGKVMYLSTRKIGEKRHYNLPVELAGERQVYFNHEYSLAAERVVIVEGQADAITLAEWGIAAIGLCGCSADDWLIALLKKHKTVYIGLDNDTAGRKVFGEIADELGPMARLVKWPEKDPNEWLQKDATADDCQKLLKDAPTWIDDLIERTKDVVSDDRDEHVHHVFTLLVKLEPFALAGRKADLAKNLNISSESFEALVKAARREAGQDDRGKPQYEKAAGRMFRRTYNQFGDDRLDLMASFSAEIVTDVVEDDGETTNRIFELIGQLPDGKPLPKIEVPSDEFPQMSWPLMQWGSRAILEAGGTVKDHMRAAILKLSPNIETRYDYRHTGWRAIDGKPVYLSNAGAVGMEGIQVRLDQALHRYSLPSEPVNVLEAVKASLRFLNVGDASIMLPLWSAMYLAPLSSIVPPSFTIWLFGTTGSMKSVSTALAMSHFGKFEYNMPPASWTGTTNALEKMAFTLKDMPLWIDDFTSQSTLQAQNELRMKADQLLRNWGNRSGRTRMNADLSLRQTFSPRGLVVSTAEQLPPVESIQSRLFQLEIAPGMIDIEGGQQSKLSVAQLIDAPLYPHAMAAYVLWLSPQMNRLEKELPIEFLRLTEKARSDAGSHLRLPANIATMFIGLKMGMTFAHEIGALDAEQLEAELELGWNLLVSMGERQHEVAVEEKPVEMYFNALEQLFASGAAYLRHKDNPTDDATIGHPQFPIPGLQAIKATFLGWYDEKYWYLLPNDAFNSVYQYYRSSGALFPDTERGVRVKLLEQKKLVTQSKSGDRYTCRLLLSGLDYQPRVLRVHKPQSSSNESSLETGTSGISGILGIEE